jgi:hypothetical protein
LVARLYRSPRLGAGATHRHHRRRRRRKKKFSLHHLDLIIKDISCPMNRDDRVTGVFFCACHSCQSAGRCGPKKKADVLERPEASNHVGLPVNGPPETSGLPFT